MLRGKFFCLLWSTATRHDCLFSEIMGFIKWIRTGIGKNPACNLGFCWGGLCLDILLWKCKHTNIEMWHDVGTATRFGIADSSGSFYFWMKDNDHPRYPSSFWTHGFLTDLQVQTFFKIQIYFSNFMGTNPTPVSMVFEGLGDFRPWGHFGRIPKQGRSPWLWTRILGVSLRNPNDRLLRCTLFVPGEQRVCASESRTQGAHVTRSKVKFSLFLVR